MPPSSSSSSVFVLPERSKEFAETLRHDLTSLPSHHKIVGIMAPTGVGKTKMVVDLFRGTPRTLMILPTQLACQQWLAQRKSTDRMVMMNASKAVDYFIRHHGFHHFRTILLDEAHVDSREYYAIRRLMHMAKSKGDYMADRLVYYFISATLPIVHLQQSFPELHVLSYDDFRPYKIDIHYDKPQSGMSSNHRPDRRGMIHMAAKRLQDLPPATKRVLVFVPTHQECDEMGRRIEASRKKNELLPTSTMGSCPLLILHGGLEPEEKEKVKQQLVRLPAFILIATNIAESSITIPDLDVIIDSGLECRMLNSSYTVVELATKMSLIQRAGRVGRTKDGVVYRLITEDVFNHLEEFNPETHDMDPIALRCLLHGCNAVKMFGKSLTCNLSFLESVNINQQTPKDKLMFLESCGLRIIAGSLLWNLKKASVRMSRRETMWIAFLIVIMDQYDKKRVSWVYQPRDSGKIANAAISRYLLFSRKLNYEGDMLVTIGRFLLSILCYGKGWRDVATNLSLNHRTIREFISDWKRVFRHLHFLFPNPKELESGPIDLLFHVLGVDKKETSLGVNTENKVEPIPLEEEDSMVRCGRQFLLVQPILYGPKLMHPYYEAPYNYEWSENVIVYDGEVGDSDDDDNDDNDDGYYSESRYFDSVYHNSVWTFEHGLEKRSLGCIIPRFDTAIHPIRLRGVPYGRVALWTNLPFDLKCHLDTLEEVGFVDWEKNKRGKEETRSKKSLLLEEIRHGIGFMPPSENEEVDPECRFSGGYLWNQAQEDFQHHVQYFMNS